MNAPLVQLHPPKSDDKYAQLTRGALIINDFLSTIHKQCRLRGGGGGPQKGDERRHRSLTS
jgi:hypothetical protein